MAFNTNIEKALQPWHSAEEGHDEVRDYALAQAVLAPSPHNMQAWQIEMVGADAVRIHPDLSRLTPEIDPHARQTVIGYGAFLELLRQAASTRGYHLRVEAFPAGMDEQQLDDRPIADVTFERAELESDPLAAFITKRRTNRDGYDAERPVPSETMQRIVDAVPDGDLAFDWTSEPDMASRIGALAQRGWEIEDGNEATHHESVRLTRIGAKEINADPDGLSINGIGPGLLHAIGLLTREKMEQDDSFARSMVVKSYNGAIDKTATFGWLVSSDNSHRTQLATGAAWVRINQAANREGVSMQPLSQVLEEFPVMADSYRAFHELLGIASPRRVQGLFRFGYAKEGELTPRWPVEAKLVRR